MAERKALSKKIRFEVFKRDSFTCQYCGNSAPEVILNVDHIEPVSKGGSNDLFNLITSCFDCNMGKKDRKLKDDTVVKKQKAELDRINEKRQQLEMLMEYRKSLIDDVKTEVNVLEQELHLLTGYGFSENYRKEVFGLIKKYGLTDCLKYMNLAYTIYVKTNTNEEVILMLQKYSGILYNKSREKEDPFYSDSTWCTNIAKKTWYLRSGDWQRVFNIVHYSLEDGVSRQDIVAQIYDAYDLESFMDNMR